MSATLLLLAETDGQPIASFWQVVGMIVTSLGAAGGIGGWVLKLQAQRATERAAQLREQYAYELKKMQTAHDLSLAQTNAEADRLMKERAEQYARQQALITSLQNEVTRLNARVDIEEKRRSTYEEKLDRLEAEAGLYRDRLNALELRGDETPVISWERDAEGRLIVANNEFEKQWLAPLNKTRGWALGKTAEEIWGPEAAKSLATIDDAATKAPTKEAVGPGVVLTPELGPFLVIKKQRLWQGRAIGMWGAAVSMARVVNPPQPS